MATTSNYGWTIPDDTDLVKNGALAIRTLGNAIDTTAAASFGGGLVHLNTTSYSAVSSQSVNDVFSATYQNYCIIMNNDTGSGGTASLRLRASGTDNTSNNYYYSLLYVPFSSTATINGLNGSGLTSSFYIGVNANDSRSVIDLQNPFAAQLTSYQWRAGNINNDFANGGGNMSVTTSYDGFTLVFTGSTTGNVSVYGYKQ